MKSQKVKKFRTRLYKITYDIYNGSEIGVIIGDKTIDAVKYVEETYNTDLKSGYDCDGYAIRLDNDNLHKVHFVICLGKDSSFSTVVHESLHIAWFFLEWEKVKVDGDNHEALAYLQGYTVDKIMSFYKRIKRKKVKE